MRSQTPPRFRHFSGDDFFHVEAAAAHREHRSPTEHEDALIRLNQQAIEYSVHSYVLPLIRKKPDGHRPRGKPKRDMAVGSQILEGDFLASSGVRDLLI